MSLLFGQMRQHRRVLLTACLLINLVLIVFYILTHTKNQKNPDPKTVERLEERQDDNGFPLFLHEPLENDQHRNNLVHSHQVRWSLRQKAPGVNPEQVNIEEAAAQKRIFIDDFKQREMRLRRNRLQAVDDEIQPGQGLLLDELSDNARRVMDENKHQVIPLNLLPTQAPKEPMESNSRVKFVDEAKHQMPARAVADMEDIDPDRIRVMFSPVTMCEDNIDVYMLIAVVSDIRRYKLRNAIRNTWGRSAASGRFATQLVFVVGKPQQEDAPLVEMIINENKQHRDILYLDLEEKHTILTYKTLAMFRWTLEYCPQARFILKTDDDVFINIPNILQDLKTMENNHGLQPKRFMLGHVIEGAKPVTDRHNKWFMPGGQFKGKVYPTYLSGSAYVLPSSLLEPIMQESHEAKIFWLEDIYITGIVAQNIKATLIHNAKFEYAKRKLGPCRFKKLNSAHELAPDDLMFVWRELNRGSLKCANTDGHFIKSIDYDT